MCMCILLKFWPLISEICHCEATLLANAPPCRPLLKHLCVRLKVTELIWGPDVEQRFPRATHCFDYILAADVVYAHPYLEELMDTFDYLCQGSTQILWAMRFRLDPENSFVGRFQQRFHVEQLYDLPSLRIKLFRAWRKEGGAEAPA